MTICKSVLLINQSIFPCISYSFVCIICINTHRSYEKNLLHDSDKLKLKIETLSPRLPCPINEHILCRLHISLDESIQIWKKWKERIGKTCCTGFINTPEISEAFELAGVVLRLYVVLFPVVCTFCTSRYTG